MGVPPKDFSVTNGDHLLLNVGLPDEQLRHAAPVSVFGDPTDPTFWSTTKPPRWSRAALAGIGSALFPRSSGVSMQASRIRACCGGARIPVVAEGNHNRCKSCKEHH